MRLGERRWLWCNCVAGGHLFYCSGAFRIFSEHSEALSMLEVRKYLLPKTRKKVWQNVWQIIWKQKKSIFQDFFMFLNGGAREIWTLARCYSSMSFPSPPLQPLEYRSNNLRWICLVNFKQSQLYRNQAKCQATKDTFRKKNNPGAVQNSHQSEKNPVH